MARDIRLLPTALQHAGTIALSPGSRALILAIGLLAGGPVLAQAQPPAPDARLTRVKVVTVAASSVAATVRLTGEIAARVQTSTAFRISGKVTAREVEIGDHITAGQVLATLDPQEKLADLQTALAALTSAQAVLVQAKLNFDRQKSLLDSGFTTHANFDQAQASLQTADAQVDSAKAAFATAQEQLSYTSLKAGKDGVITARQVEVGQVVEAGQTAFIIAEDGPRDAVFNVYEALLLRPPQRQAVDIALQSDPSIATKGLVREVAPAIDPASGTVKVKIGLDGTPPQMMLGAAVIGQGRFAAENVLTIPWGALFEWNGKPAVWVVDAKGMVNPKAVEVASYVTGSVVLSGGVSAGDKVVSAGIQFLYPGQSVTVTEDKP